MKRTTRAKRDTRDIRLLDAYLFSRTDADNVRAAAQFILQVCTDGGQQGEGERVHGELEALAKKIETTLPRIILAR